MGREITALAAAPVAELGHRIEEWRRKRVHRRTAMPAELWAEATSLARRFGVYQVSRELGLNYKNLKRRVVSSVEDCRASVQARFVEVSGAGVSSFKAHDGFEVELSRSDSVFMRIRRCGEIPLDVAGVVDAFCRAR